MKKIALTLFVLMAGTASAVDTAAIKSACAAKLEQLAEKMIPPKYEQQKTGYLQKARAFLALVKLTVRFGE